jgi:hypothetical protein
LYVVLDESFERGQQAMDNWIELATRTALIGIGATMVMDAWLAVLNALGVPTMNIALLGRWVAHAARGEWFHAAIAKTSPVRGELAIGWMVHYGIGIGFAGLLVGLCGVEWIRAPAFASALLIGLVTVAAPLLIVQPAMGAGIASSKTAAPLRNCLKSLLNHAVFGCGLYIAAATLQWI